MRFTTVDSPLGPLRLAASDRGLAGLYLPDHQGQPVDPPVRSTGAAGIVADRLLARAAEQLAGYFAGVLTDFDLPIILTGSAGQQAVWQLLRTVPYASTTSYKALAIRLGNPGASRAVGSANARNPVCIVVPCHRVVGSDGGLTGYAGGLPNKRWLLAHELTHSGAALF